MENSIVHVDSADRKVNCIGIYNRKGTVSISKDKEDSVDCSTDNENFIVQQLFK